MKQIPTKLQHRLTRYSFAAGAAGLAAGAQQADAAIQVYDNGGSGWTISDNESLWFTYTGSTTAVNPGAGFLLRNNPGSYSPSFGGYKGSYRRINVAGNDDGVIQSALAFGAPIPGTAAQANNVNMTYAGSGTNGFPVPGSAYLGLIFDVGGDKYYGWMDVTLNANIVGGGDTIVVNRFAVEDAPNTATFAGDTGGGGGGGSSAVPEPGTLALLVLGATGLTALRRRET